MLEESKSVTNATVKSTNTMLTTWNVKFPRNMTKIFAEIGPYSQNSIKFILNLLKFVKTTLQFR
jgi:hypothetical protein